jgi:hypothetical protein
MLVTNTLAYYEVLTSISWVGVPHYKGLYSQKLISSQLTNGPNKLECFSLASLSRLV